MSDYQTRVYRYGLLPPVVGAELVEEQIRLAHRYRNQLVEIERDRRDDARKALAINPEVARLDEEIEKAEAALEAFREKTQAERSGTKRKQQSPESAAVTRLAREQFRQLRADRRKAIATAKKDQAVKDALKAADQRAKDRHKATRAEYQTAGSYWCTRALADAAADQARKSITPPRFARWTGDGAVAVQLQSQGDRIGRSVECITSCEDRQMQLDLTEQSVPGRGGKDRPRVRLRVGSDGRDPVWAEWPVILHRPLPSEARVMWAKAVRRRIGTHFRWSLHITLRLPPDWITEAGGVGGAVALDLGWRRVETDGQVTVRSGGWAGTDEESGEVVVHPAILGQLVKSADLQAIRDRRVNDVRDRLMAWKAATDLPQEHVDRMDHLHVWRAAARFAALAIWWRDHRFDGDAAMLAELEAWRRKDRHLLEWQVHAKRKAIARRRYDYRNLAADLSRRYETLVVEKLDLRKIAKRPDPEAPSYEERSDTAQSQRTVAAPGELRKMVVEAFVARGGTVVEVDPAGSAAEILEAWFAGSGDAVEPGTARGSKWAKVRELMVGDQAGASSAT